MYPMRDTSRPPPRGDGRPMSIDAMLDQERVDVLALLGESNRTAAARTDANRRSASPYATPRSPVRSMLDIEEEPANTTNHPTSPMRQGPIRSMLDFSAPVPSAPRPSQSGRNTAPNSPTMPTIPLHRARSGSSSSHYRPMPDVPTMGLGPADHGIPRPLGSPRLDPTAGYQFAGIYNHLGGSSHQMPLRAAQKGSSSSKKSTSTSLGSTDMSALQFPGERGRNSSLGGALGSRLVGSSKSPHGRMGHRSTSPATFSPKLPQGKTYLDDGKILDMNSAYRRLSDAHLKQSAGSLSQLPMRKQTDEAGEGRLIKDYRGPDGEHLGSSEEDEPDSTDDEDRGRKKAPKPLDSSFKGEGSKSRSRERKSLSLLAAAEQERTEIASNYKYKSLFEPEIKITNSSGDVVKSTKRGVQPHTSYDHKPGSATASVMDSDEEQDFDDIKRAQKLSFSMTNIMNNSEAHRAIRIIYRGEYQKISQTAEEEHRRLRKYLVATDLSDESTHALEWAIGTVLRDGDTLIAIYCVDEETGIVTGEGSLVPDDPTAMREQAAAINTVANASYVPPMKQVTDFKRSSILGAMRGTPPGTPGSSPAPNWRNGRGKAEEERHKAVQEISDKVLRLLRKTQLQVRVMVEVLHCKNPKHLITEVIDLVSPTLVVIGSRGRSALKGVILGSFSNYLVTKSSVPVMVARKRLRKQSKYKSKAVRQVNNLSNPTARSLANAKID